jgi:hypothetical protein
MNANGATAAETVKAAYARAVAGGANIHVAFDLACKAYRVAHPSADESGLRQTVAAEVGLSREDAIMIEIGASA